MFSSRAYKYSNASGIPARCAAVSGNAVDKTTCLDGKSLTTAYPYGGFDYSVRTDECGRVTIRRQDVLGDCVETGETVFTNGVEVMKMKSRYYFGGGSSMRREWGGDRWTEERRFEDYAADGVDGGVRVEGGPDGVAMSRVFAVNFCLSKGRGLRRFTATNEVGVAVLPDLSADAQKWLYRPDWNMMRVTRRGPGVPAEWFSCDVSSHFFYIMLR